MVSLIEEGDPRPTARRVADRAGVCIRTLYHHFHGIDAVFCGAATAQIAVHHQRIVPLPARGPLEVRVLALCRQRRYLFEAVAPLLRTRFAGPPMRPELRAAMGSLSVTLQRELATTFRDELVVRAGRADTLFSTLDVLTGWHCWESLRFGAARSPSEAERVMARMVLDLFA
jgi:AcrR family transcriptional regulator